MNIDQRRWFAKNIVKSYKQNRDLKKVLAHPECKDQEFLGEIIVGLIQSVMGKTHDTFLTLQFLEEIEILPEGQKLAVARTAFNAIGTKYWQHQNLVEHSFLQVCDHGTSDDLLYVFDIWAQSYAQQLLLPLYIQKAPERWQIELEHCVVQTMAQNRYPYDLFRFIPHVNSYPLSEVVDMYLKGFCRSADHSMQEVERIVNHNSHPQMLDFAKILLDRFANHQNFAQWHNIPKSRHERMTVKVQNIVLSQQIDIENIKIESMSARSRKI